MVKGKGVSLVVFFWFILSASFAQTKLKVSALLKHREDLLFQGAVLSPEGDRLISVDNLGMLYLWDIKKEYPIRYLPMHKGGAFACAYSQDGKFIVTGGEDKTIKITKTRDLSLVKNLENLPSPAREVAMVGNRIIALLQNSEVRVYSTETWDLVTKPKYAANNSRVLVNNKGDKFYVWFSSRIYEMATIDGELLNLLSTDYATPTDLAISPDDKLLAVGFGQAEEIIRIYNVADMSQVKSVKRNGAGDQANGLAFLNNSNKLLYHTSAGAASFKIFDLEKGTHTSVSKGDPSSRTSLSKNDKNVVLSPKFGKAIQVMSMM